jgi:hypothetical protein
MTTAPWPKPDRIPCAVTGCRRTAPKAKYPPRTRIICHRHWQTGLNMQERRTWSKWRREADRIRETINNREGKATDDELGRVELLDGMCHELWDLAVRRAFDAEAGI